MTELIKKSLASPAGDDPLAYVMSDATVDRMSDVIEAAGWQLKNFVKNSIALLNHDSRVVIGHWTDVQVEGEKLISKLNLLPTGTIGGASWRGRVWQYVSVAVVDVSINK